MEEYNSVYSRFMLLLLPLLMMMSQGAMSACLWDQMIWDQEVWAIPGDNDCDTLADIDDDDDDNDGMPDVYESQKGFDPLNASDATQDSDGDGILNVDEYRNGTDPHDPKDPLPDINFITPILNLLLE